MMAQHGAYLKPGPVNDNGHNEVRVSNYTTAEPIFPSTRCSKGWWDIVTSPFTAQHPPVAAPRGSVLPGLERPRVQKSQYHVNPFIHSEESLLTPVNEWLFGLSSDPVVHTSLQKGVQSQQPDQSHKRMRPRLQLKIPPPSPESLRITEIRRSAPPKPAVEPPTVVLPLAPTLPAPAVVAERRLSGQTILAFPNSPPAYAGVASVDFFEFVRNLEAGQAPARQRQLLNSDTSTYVPHRAAPPIGAGETAGRGLVKEVIKERLNYYWEEHFSAWCVLAVLGGICLLCVCLAMVTIQMDNDPAAIH